MRRSLRTSDGYDGDIGAGSVQLWSVAELGASNEGYDRSSVPGLTLIGSNGGPTAYAIDAHAGDAFVSVPFVPMDRREVRALGATFGDFLAALAKGDGW